MLERVRLTDFKSFADEEAALSPLTILVGANASGKSNFLDAIRFLQQTLFDQTLAEVLDGDKSGASGWPGIRGGAREAARTGTSTFAIETTWTAPVSEDMDFEGAAWPDDRAALVQVTHRIACRTTPEPKLEAESLGRGTTEGNLYRTGAIRGDTVELPWPPIPWRSRETTATVTRVSRDQSISWTILGSLNPGSPSVPDEVGDYASALSVALYRLEFPDIQPARMRGYGRTRRPLGQDGGNISGVLADLCSDPEEKRTIVDWLAELCAPELVDLDFIDVPELGDTMAVFVEKGGRRISARSLSDGTLRFLGLVVALRTCRPGSVVFLEDIESHLHPARIRLLVEYLESIAHTGGVQIVATTHSPVVLQWLSEEALERAIVFGRVPDREGTLMRRLGELPHFSDVVKRKGIDELFTTGWLEMAL